MYMVSLDTYDSAKGFDLGRRFGVASTSPSESSKNEGFPFLAASTSRSAGAPLFFFPLGGRVTLFLLYVFVMGGGGFGVFGHSV